MIKSQPNPIASIQVTVRGPGDSPTDYVYEILGRLLSTTGRDSSDALVNRHAFVYDAAGQRSEEILLDDSTRLFEYDPYRQLTSATKAVPSTEYDFGYAYDSIGNRLSALNDEDLTTYISNTLNQYTQITLPDPEPAQVPTYDLNGNMLGNGGDSYIWDEENRLIRIEYADGSSSEFDYDGLSRRVERREFDSTATLIEIMRYVYDGLLPIQELDGENAEHRSYTRGLDLTQTMQGAGGVGGILAMTEDTGENYFYFYDGNGNVTDLIDETDAVSAHYVYDPFGKVIAQTGSLDQPFQFSTKAYHSKSGLNHYLYRWYSPELGRWPNRDPIEEDGGANLYGFVGNNTVNSVDSIGLWFWKKEKLIKKVRHEYTQTMVVTDPNPKYKGWNLSDEKGIANFDVYVNSRSSVIFVAMNIAVYPSSPRTKINPNTFANWTTAINSKWSGKFKVCCPCSKMCKTGCPIRFRTNISYFGGISDPHFQVQASKSGSSNQSLTHGLNGTANMSIWGMDDTVDVTHEFGHMLGNTDEYFNVNGIPYGAHRQPGGNIMNNPSGLPQAKHYNLIAKSVGSNCTVVPITEKCQ